MEINNIKLNKTKTTRAAGKTLPSTAMPASQESMEVWPGGQLYPKYPKNGLTAPKKRKVAKLSSFQTKQRDISHIFYPSN